MTMTPSPKAPKRKFYLLTAILITFALILIAITTRSRATSFFSASDLTPTAIPPDILTQLASTPTLATQTPGTDHYAQVTQAYFATIQAAAAFPTHTQQEIFP